MLTSGYQESEQDVIIPNVLACLFTYSLMATLGYSRYIAQGGDWGAFICRALAK